MAEQLRDVLEDCRRRLETEESIQACLERYPDDAAQLADLLPVALALHELRQKPDSTFAHDARARFHALVVARQEDSRMRQPARARRLIRRFLIPLAALSTLGISGIGLVTASADALPDSPLYAVQQAQVQVAQHIALRPEWQVAYQLRLAEHRLAQLQQAERRHASPQVIDQLSASMVQATSRAAQETSRLPAPAQERVAQEAAPLLLQEQHALATSRADAVRPLERDAQREHELLAAQKQLQRLPRTGSPAAHVTPRPATTPARSAIPTVRPGVTRAAPEHSPAAVSLAPVSTTRPPRDRNALHLLASRAARLPRLFHNLASRPQEPVHTATP